MNEDFFYALVTGWSILLIFWITIIVFISIRKPPKSRLTNKIIMYSLLIFIFKLMILLFLNTRFAFI